MEFISKQIKFGIAVTVMVLLYVSSAHAIPAFTRAHKVECSTCHTMSPELNAYGAAYLKESSVYFANGKQGKETLSTPTPQPPSSRTTPANEGEVKGEGDADKLSKLKTSILGGTTSSTPQE